MIKRLPPVEVLHEMLDYDPATGIFIWLERPLSHFPYEGERRRWNGKFAGKPAGYVNTRGYRVIGISIRGVSKTYIAHRLAWLLVRGKPVPRIIDHIDGNPDNNRIGNLRRATNAQNMSNAGKMATNTSGTKGVYLERDGRWRARVTLGGKQYDCGRFETMEEAAEARRYGAAKLHGRFARHE